MKKIIVAFFVVVLFCSCQTTKYITVPEVHTDTMFVSKVEHDSILVRDSVYLHEYMRGDTVFIEHTRWLTRFVDKYRVDTLVQHRTDVISEPYPVEVVKEVERELNWWQKIRMWLGTGVLIAGVFVILHFVLQDKFLK